MSAKPNMHMCYGVGSDQVCEALSAAMQKCFHESYLWLDFALKSIHTVPANQVTPGLHLPVMPAWVCTFALLQLHSACKLGGRQL